MSARRPSQRGAARQSDEAARGADEKTRCRRSRPRRAASRTAAEPAVRSRRSCRRSNSITAATDIRAFLAPGVPAELTRAALRRAWSADPKIRDFVGLADYDWDYHAPGSMAGFGPLEMTDELRRQVARIVGGEH